MSIFFYCNINLEKTNYYKVWRDVMNLWLINYWTSFSKKKNNTWCFTFDTEFIVPGAGAFEVAAHKALVAYKEEVKGRARLGVQAFADAMLVIPKVLAQNGGFDPQDSIVKMQEAYIANGPLIGLDLESGEPTVPADLGIFDNYRVKKQILHSWLVLFQHFFPLKNDILELR